MSKMPTFALALGGALFVAGLAGGVVGCGGNEPAQSPSLNLPPYEGNQVVLFDDTIDPASVGLSLDGQNPANNPHLRSRALEADVVGRIRVQTFTRDAVGAKIAYNISLQVAQPTLLPANTEQTQFDVVVTQNDPSFALVQSLENEQRLQKVTFIGFLRRFVSDDGPRWHWHLTSDQESVIQVIQEIAVLEEVAGQNKP